MRRAGYEVRVLPEEMGWEENPPTLIEFIRRDLRWCQGNMQYWRFLVLPGLRPVSRYQLAVAILDVPRLAGLDRPVDAWHARAGVRRDAGRIHPARRGMALVRACPGDVVRAARLATVIDVLMRPAGARCLRWHGAFPWQCRDRDHLLRSCWSRSCGSATPSSWPGCRSATSIGWIGQTRDDHAVPLALALRNLWPHTLLGLRHDRRARGDASGSDSLCAVPRRRPGVGDPARGDDGIAFGRRRDWRVGIGRLPEETTPPPALSALALPAVEMAAPATPPRPRPA